MSSEDKKTKKTADANLVEYKADSSFIRYRRFVTIPKGLMTMEDFRKLQSGGVVKLKKNELKGLEVSSG